jgi:hypothetical protein
MIAHLIRPVAILCSLMLMFWLFSAGMRRHPDSHDPMLFTLIVAIVSALPIALTTIGLCVAKKDGAIFVACCVVLFVAGYSIYMSLDSSYFTALVMRSLFSWGALFAGGIIALIANASLTKKV